MKQRSTLSLIIFFTITAWFHSQAQAIEKINVFASILPQKYFIEKIGGDFINAHVMVKPDKSPADYEPSPSQMRILSKARAYFAIGVAFENTWLQKFASINPDMQIIHTEKGITKKPINRHSNIQLLSSENNFNAHSHHKEGIKDPHIWLAPLLVKIQAENIYNALILIDPEHAAAYNNNYQKFISQINALDRNLKQLFSLGTKQKQFLVFHPSWGYFADAYGLSQVSIEIEGKAPKAQELTGLIKYATQHGIKTIFVQPQFSTKHAKIIANEIHGKIVFADPMAEDWQKNLIKVAQSIKNAF